MKKRNCRMIPEKREQHERATKIRKMTDQQLCEYMDAGAEYSPEDRFPFIRRQAVEDFLSDVQTCCKGIGQATIAKLRQYARANGSII